MSTTLVLGGARSGKSRYAEQLLRDRDDVTYVAPGHPPNGSDPEWSARIAAHRAARPATWRTVESTNLLRALTAAEGPVIIDCLATWLARLVDDIGGWAEPIRAAEHIAGAAAALEQAWRDCSVDVVAVSNEVGLGVVPATASGRLFRDELGRVNARLAASADRVVLVVAGRVLDLSAAPVVGEPPR